MSKIPNLPKPPKLNSETLNLLAPSLRVTGEIPNRKNLAPFLELTYSLLGGVVVVEGFGFRV